MAPGRHLYPDARPEYSLGIPQKASMYHSQLYNTVKVDHLSYSIESQGRALLEPPPAAPTPARVAGQEEFTTAGTTAISYTLSNMTLQIEVLGMASSVLDEIVAERISQVV